MEYIFYVNKKKIFMHKVHSMPQISNLRVRDITSEEIKFHISIFKNYRDKTQFLRFFGCMNWTKSLTNI